YLDSLPRPLRLVGLLVVCLAGDAVVLEPGVNALPGRRKVGADVVPIEIEADVAVEIAVPRVPRVALVRAPDLLRAVRISSEGRYPRRAGDRRVDAIDGARLRVADPVAVDEEVADAGSRELFVEPGLVRAFG